MLQAPELFNREHACGALRVIESALVSADGIGMRTLDPEHPNYRPYYSNEDSDDRSVAGGFNYHNGPVRRGDAVDAVVSHLTNGTGVGVALWLLRAR